MLITIFEQKEFSEWCSNGVDSSKTALINRAFNLLMTMTFNARDIKKYKSFKPVLDENLDSVSVANNTSSSKGEIFNTCLPYQCLTIFYDIDSIVSLCSENNFIVADFEMFLTRLSNFITDAVVLEWKMSKGLRENIVKVGFSRGEYVGFFPVSTNLLELINVIQRLTLKEVIFTPEQRTTAQVSKKYIECYFSPNRLESEYLVQQQLLEIYMHSKGFDVRDKYHFTDMSNWSYSDDDLTAAFNIILQNRFSNMLAWEVYPVYDNPSLYDLLNFRCSDVYMDSTCKFLCEYCRHHRVCSNCTGIEDIYSSDNKCPLYADGSIMSKTFTLDELATVNCHSEAVKSLKNVLVGPEK